MDVLGYLFNKYYGDATYFSQSTSSHWQKYGAFQNVKIKRINPEIQIH